MQLKTFFTDLDLFPVVLIVLGVLLISAVYIFDHNRKKKRNLLAGEPHTNLDKSDQSPDESPRDPKADTSVAGKIQRPALDLQTLPQRPPVLFDLFRVLLIFLSIVVAGGFLLILLPQSTTDDFIEDIRARSNVSDQEMIAFLYLGHEIQNNEFRIRGVVRNITTEPIEQLDAAVRLYSPNRDLLETVIVRMDKETIEPDQIAQFELVYPNYKSEFSSYAVDFKLRRGGFVLYKDMRGIQEESETSSDTESN